MRMMLAAAIAALSLNMAHAHDTEVTSPPMRFGGGLICDTLEQAIEHITTQPRRTLVEGCGVLQGMSMATVTLLPDVVHNGLRFHMVRFNFVVPTPWNNQVQYGFWGKPVPEKPKGDAI